ncbi:IPT/TIG domain-containing protein [Neomoorella humiferrea]|uniref:IPT/TIG domain-containing protein n=1 Tax=Neomoorella humiferrea TaxID=676965 RepID=UPI003D8B7009
MGVKLLRVKIKPLFVVLLAAVAVFFSWGNNAAAAAAPLITSITPANGPMTGGTWVTVNGSYFAPGAQVYFDDEPALEVTFSSSSKLLVKTPPRATSGKVDVKVVNPDGQQYMKVAAFLYDPVVTEVITGEEGRTGSTTGGQWITVKGSGFQNNLILYIGSNPATQVTVSADGQTITALTPPGTVGKVAVKVVNPDGGTGILPATDANTFTYRLSQPEITAVSPASGTWLGGTEVTISGKELSPSGVVRFGGVPATIKQANDITSLVVITPRGSVGLQDVTITNPDGQTSPVTSATKFEFIATPVIDAVTPNYGSPQGGTEVTITGSNFPPAGQIGVTFGGRAAVVQEVGAGYIKVITPENAPGTVAVTVYDTSNPEKSYTVLKGFTYITEKSSPVITAITPNAGSKDGGTEVTITGSDFRSGVDVPLKVKFGSVYAAQVTVKSTTELLVVAPPSTVTGPVDVTVENPDGGKATYPYGFTYLAPERVLLITGITPNRGSMEGGTPVVVNGANFLDPADPSVADIELTIGGNPVKNLTWDAASKAYRGVTPAGYGTQDVVLLIKRWQDGILITEKALLPGGFTYVVPQSKPQITAIDPAGGPLSGGTLIHIYGSDFRAPQAGETVQVYIGSLPASGVQVVSSTEITAVTPKATSTGLYDVTVINPDLATAVLPNAFTYVSSTMTIVSVTPDKGPVDRETMITITGANFNQDRDETGMVYLVVELGTAEEGYLPATGVVVSDDGATITALTPRFTAGTKDVVVRNHFGSVTLPGAFTYYVPSSKPEIAGVYPATGPTTGGTPITIYGDRFQSKASVTIGGRMATGVEVVSPAEIRAVTPAGQPGRQDIVVTNPDGGTSALAAGFTYVSHPVVKNVTPSRGSVAGGTIVTLQGADFYPGMQVYFGSITEVVYGNVGGSMVWQVPASDVQVIDTQTARVRLPAWSESVAFQNGARVDIAVVNSDAVLTSDGGSFIAHDIFTYYQPLTSPRVDEVTPNFGPVQGGNEVLLSGDGFQPDVKVYFGWEEARVLEVTPNFIRVSAPTNEAGLYDITVVNVYDTGVFIKEDAYEYRQPLTAPKITGVFPSMGPAGGGTLLTISGAYFWPGVRVFIGNNEAFLYVDAAGQIVPKEQGVQSVAPLVTAGGTIIYVHTPEGPKVGENYIAGPVDVIVVNPDGGSAILKGGFTYKLPDSRPVITGVSPDRGTIKGGTPVTITGSDFREELKVYFGGKEAVVNKIDPGAIEVVTPAHDAGTVDVTVVNKDGGVATAYRAFTYLVPGSEPVVKSIDPGAGSVLGGTRVTIGGEDFREGVKVYFGGTEALEVVRVDYKTVTAVTPPHVAGTVDVTVVNPDAGSYTLRRAFTYQGTVPRIDAVAPERGPQEGDIKVVIRGADFLAPVQVYFGTAAAAGATVVENGAMIEVTLPAAPQGRLGAVDVKVVNGDGAEAVKEKAFTYVVPDSRPVITGIEPSSGSTLGGNWVTITGEDFREGPQVFIGGQPVLEVKLIDGRTLRVKMPPHSEGPKDVTVTNYDGGTCTLAAAYTYKTPESQPVINKVEPARGPHVGGTAITVTGLDFRQGVKLYIGGAPALNVVRVDYKTITAVTPAGSVGPADVTVVNPDEGTFTLPKGFTFYYVEAPVVTAVTPNEGPATGGTAIQISGQKFAKGAMVSIGGVLAPDVKWVNDSLITATTPPGSIGWQEVRVVNPDGGWGALANGFHYLKPRGVPATPTGFRAWSINDGQGLELTWDAAEFANYYEIWAAESPGGPYRFFARTKDTIFYSDDLPGERELYFRVRAVNEFGYSEFSEDDYAATAESTDEESGGYYEDLKITSGRDGVEAVIKEAALLAGDYRVDLSTYGGSRPRYVVRVAAAAAAAAKGSLSIGMGEINLTVPAAALREVYRSTLGGAAQDDAWVEIVVEDRGQGEAEALLKGLPAGGRVASRVWGVQMQGRMGARLYSLNYFPGGGLLIFNTPGVLSPAIYASTAFSAAWQPVTSAYTPRAARILLAGKYALIDLGGK